MIVNRYHYYVEICISQIEDIKLSITKSKFSFELRRKTLDVYKINRQKPLKYKKIYEDKKIFSFIAYYIFPHSFFIPKCIQFSKNKLKTFFFIYLIV